MFNRERAETEPDQPAFVMGTSGGVVTYGEYESRCNRLAHLLRAHGLRTGQHVAIFMENNSRYLEMAGAAERAGLYYTLVNSYLTADEVAYLVNDCEARALLTSGAKCEVSIAAAALCPDVRLFLMCEAQGDPPAPFLDYEGAVAAMPSDPIPDERTGAPMLYSSGTTGRPKGILRPLPDTPPPVIPGSGQFTSKLFGFRRGMVYLSPAPLYHSAPLASVSLTIRHGGTAVLMEHFDPVSFLDLIGRHRVTHTQVVPTMLSRLLKLPEELRQASDLSSLEVLYHAAAPCPIAVKRAVIDWLGPIVLEYYAATEGYGFTFCTTDEWLAHPGTVGRPLVGELLILDETGQEVGLGEEGTVWFRGATTFEYFKDPGKTAESRRQDDAGTASTVGDIGRVDEDGYLYLTDRKSHVIISGGVNIYPQETENLLVTHPKVLDAAVIGVPDEDLGEQVKAVVQVAPGVSPGPELAAELVAFCREHLAHFKCPRSVDFTEELPRLPTGKLYKRLLRDRYWGRHSSRII